MTELVLREKIPDIPLPFYPHSTGVNLFPTAGPKEDMKGIGSVEICTVSQGECEISQRGKMVHLTAGQSVYKYPGEPRKKTVISPEGAVIYWATFDGPLAETFMRSFALPEGPLPTGECPCGLYQEIARNLILGTDDAFRRMTALYTELIACLPGPAKAAEDRIFSECMILIRTRFADPDFNVDALADELKIHRSTLLRMFRKKMNCSPQKYLIQYRIRHAQHLLRTTLIPIAEIAECSGFRQCNYFCRIIRQYCGQTPEQYRKSC